VAGLSLVTNPAAGLSGARLTHEDVQAVAARAAAALEAVLAAFLPRAAR
jgi:purine nucleoside phosphorylase